MTDNYAFVPTVEGIKSRHYECFIEGHEPLRWSPGRCADYTGRNVHLMRCKRKDGHGLGGLFCKQHAKDYPA
jgi:hypothetical protein